MEALYMCVSIFEVFILVFLSDSPQDKPVLVASNEAKTSYEFKVLGDNIFAGVRSVGFLFS
jgi:hypothetical protein